MVDHQGDADSDRVQDITYTYDVFDRRVAETQITYTYDGGQQQSATSEEFVYDGANVIFDFVGSGQTNVPTTRYLNGNAVDQVFAQEDSADDPADDVVYWLLHDNLNSTQYVLNADGSMATHLTYDPFGRVLSGDASLTRYLYTGRELDAATELQYNRERWYDPNDGRWISEDPIGFAGDPSNLYRYVGNSPTNAIDSSGLEQAVARAHSLRFKGSNGSNSTSRCSTITMRCCAA